MRNFVRLATVLLALVAAAACVPTAEFGQTISVSTATSQPDATATPAPPRENVAALGIPYSFEKSETAHLAIDGDPETVWNSKQLAPQWFSIVFDEPVPVDRIEMVVTQLPAGPTTHEVWLADESGSRVLYKRLINVYTEDGQTLEVAIEPQRNISEVLIHTIDSPSWVAWREVRVFGPRSAGLLEAEASAPEKRDTVTTELKRPESETSTSVGENVAPLGSGFASAEEKFAHFAIDDDASTIWDSQFLPPQWFSIALDHLYLVSKIEMVVAQALSGPISNEVWLGDG